MQTKAVHGWKGARLKSCQREQAMVHCEGRRQATGIVAAEGVERERSFSGGGWTWSCSFYKLQQTPPKPPKSTDFSFITTGLMTTGPFAGKEAFFWLLDGTLWPFEMTLHSPSTMVLGCLVPWVGPPFCQLLCQVPTFLKFFWIVPRVPRKLAPPARLNEAHVGDGIQKAAGRQGEFWIW